MTTDIVPIKRALLSVFDKTGMEAFAKGLAGFGVELVSTGGTAKLIAGTGAAVRDIADLTGFPEMMDGRVKTLHPKVHGGLLAVRDNPTHKASMDEHQIAAIDLVVVNLYPFEATIAKGASYDETIENIDIGGPAMIRSAAKNHAYVTVVVDPGDYEPVLEAIRQDGGVPYGLRQKLAAKAYARTAAYDATISNWFARTLGYNDIPYRSFGGKLAEVMRYGENPHQWAAFYTTGDKRPGVATAT
ncbi:MAG: bifunctional phosphoribosylaminoimidazolecarboxamide formyltransferase/IMP cyclohydrolase, partial [Devosia sp.]|nr:bifunctional phosphoribosylaminoimidazolecarboxamide formyltransferase/IMP cyclohydrolase [Devosia sp.]